METQTTKTPIHLWIVGGLALLWNGFGCFDYLMTRTRGVAYVESMMHTDDGEAIMAYIDAFPVWAAVGWGLGVWGGLVGAILLLLRHRWAVPVLLASLVGAIVGIVHQLANPSGIPELSMGINEVMPYVIIAIAVGLFVYARAMRIRNLLA